MHKRYRDSSGVQMHEFDWGLRGRIEIDWNGPAHAISFPCTGIIVEDNSIPKYYNITV